MDLGGRDTAAAAVEGAAASTHHGPLWRTGLVVDPSEGLSACPYAARVKFVGTVAVVVAICATAAWATSRPHQAADHQQSNLSASPRADATNASDLRTELPAATMKTSTSGHLRILAGDVPEPTFPTLPRVRDSPGAQVTVRGKWLGTLTFTAAQVRCRRYGRAHEYALSTSGEEEPGYGLNAGEVFLAIVVDNVQPEYDEVDLTFASRADRDELFAAGASFGPGPDSSVTLHYADDAGHRRIRFSARTVMGPDGHERLGASGWVSIAGSISYPG